MLHASETWPLTMRNLQRNDRAMIRQICRIKPEDVATVRSSELLAKLQLEDLYLFLRESERRLSVQLASYLERGPLMWMMPSHLHVNQKSDYDDDDESFKSP